MRISSLYKIAFLSFFALTLTSCEDEPLDGDFLTNNPANLIPSFTAKVDGADFVAATSFAVTSDNKTKITGIKGNGDIIVLTYNGVGTGTFNLSGTSGEGQFGINTNPDLFSTKHENVGGSITVTKYDANTGHISGTFSFTAAWPLKDANGQPILDNAGNPTFQIINISDGKFTNVPLTGGVNNPNPNPNNGKFSASVDGTAFNADGPNSGAFYMAGSQIVTLAGMQSDNSYIQINVVNPAVGVFDLAGDINNQSVAVYGVLDQSQYTSMTAFGGSGTINITKFDLAAKKMSGTFEFVGVNDLGDIVNVTTGVFTDIYIETDAPGDGTSSFKADIDGVALNPDAVNTSVTNGEYLNILALNNSTGKSIGITFALDKGVGTYDFYFMFTQDDANGIYMPTFGSQQFYTSISGTLNITSVGANSREGTFEFDAEDMADGFAPLIIVTNGEFKVTF